MHERLLMPYRISIDTGGTFTDITVADDEGRLLFGKSLTTPERMFSGARTTLTLLAEELGIGLRDLLAETALVIYGTTRSTNAIVEHKTAPTALLVTEGFPDILRLREGGKLRPFDFTIPYPEPYVPHRLTFEIPERVNAAGETVVALDEERAAAAVRAAVDAGAEAIAVCLLWSIVNPAHEQRLGALIEVVAPGLPYTLSAALNPIPREYRRGSSTAIDASLKPLMQQHLAEIEADLHEEGFGGELLIVTCLGGCLHVEEMVERPLFSVNSGPSMAPVAARSYARAAGLAASVIVCDTGGTSFDVSLIEGDRIKTTHETWLGGPFLGHITGLSSVDVKSIGAGGGSIAWVDEGGLLRVGPQSAGAVPGPACYGSGGKRPTVTDAAALLGYLDPDYFLGGRMALDLEAAERVIGEHVAAPLGMPLHEAAEAILTVATESMVSAIREITIQQGVDPRECILVAGGGAGALNAAAIGDALGVGQVLIPRTAGALSACGAQIADVIAQFAASAYTDTGEFAFAKVNEALGALQAEARRFLERIPAGVVTGSEQTFSVDARYPSQVWDLEVDLPLEQFEDEADVAAFVDRFHAEHQRVFAVHEAGQSVECATWRGRVAGLLHKPDLAHIAMPASDAGQATSRQVYFGGSGLCETLCVRPEDVTPGTPLTGPVIVEEPTTTVVVPPGFAITLLDSGSYLLEPIA